MIVDRCESCHLGIRSPIPIRASDMVPLGRGRMSRPDRLARAFVSHPSNELLKIHDPEKFGCSSCHWGNGRATTSEEKGHGRHRFWLHPLFAKENTEAGCNQCHSADRVLQGANDAQQGQRPLLRARLRRLPPLRGLRPRDRRALEHAPARQAVGGRGHVERARREGRARRIERGGRLGRRAPRNSSRAPNRSSSPTASSKRRSTSSTRSPAT